MIRTIDVVGIGDDGLGSLSPAAHALVDGADVLVGGARHLAMLPEDGRERLAWPSPFDPSFAMLAALHERRVCVLASGDPSSYGVARTLCERFGPDAVNVVPSPDAFALACARLGWARESADALSVHGRPLALLTRYLQPRARLLVLCRDGDTPAEAARLLVERGFGPSALHALSHLGGERERVVSATAEQWSNRRCDDLCTLAVECTPAPGTRALARGAGLPDDAFEHDGQLTKRDVRAMTLARLAPCPGERLWDLGAGCGSVAIEWLRADPRNTAVAVERDATRAGMLARNAVALGTPGLDIRRSAIADVLAALSAPDAIFIGGGVAGEGVVEGCLQRLPAGGRLVANAVTLAGEQRLAGCADAHGGHLLRIALSHRVQLGRHAGMRPSMTVTQWTYTA